MAITSYYDPLIAKIIVKKDTRETAIQCLLNLLDPLTDAPDFQPLRVQGPPNNLEFLAQVLRSQTFEAGRATTEWIDRGGLNFTPRYARIAIPFLVLSLTSK